MVGGGLVRGGKTEKGSEVGPGVWASAVLLKRRGRRAHSGFIGMLTSTQNESRDFR